MLKKQIKKITYDCINGIKKGDEDASGVYLARLKRLKEYVKMGAYL